ncbi:tryptophan synthase subunit alpha [Anaerocolumna sp.]|uniref:tryptophan synthase subunit alpha n=1 Tax=Anaerocolumna sp. TaxID=2041569 RepID=UPI0028B25A2D|nr:tryptophan synthase subunit alpha [Anaerocolumna sp.]
MNRIEKVFAKGKAFIPFITAGDPSLDTTGKLIIEMAKAGADLIEIGIPFSDPVAEGIVIQQADERALAGGTTTDKIFKMVEEIRKQCDIPLAFMTYINPIFAYGREKFLKNCQSCGIEAIIVPDLPFEEKGELKPYCDKYGVELISFIAPTSQERIRRIAREARGFVYCVSSMGVTGVRNELTDNAREMIRLVKAEQNIPCTIGFGIATPEQAEELALYGDGIIVGSAIVKMAGEYGNDCVKPICEYVKRMKEAICSH